MSSPVPKKRQPESDARGQVDVRGGRDEKKRPFAEQGDDGAKHRRKRPSKEKDNFDKLVTTYKSQLFAAPQKGGKWFDE